MVNITVLRSPLCVADEGLARQVAVGSFFAAIGRLQVTKKYRAFLLSYLAGDVERILRYIVFTVNEVENVAPAEAFNVTG